MGAVERAAEIAAMSKRDQKKAIAAAVAAGEEAVLAALPEPLALAAIGRLAAVTDIGAAPLRSALTSEDRKRRGAALRALAGGPRHPSLPPLLLPHLRLKSAQAALAPYGEAILAPLAEQASGPDPAAALAAVKMLGQLGAAGVSVRSPLMTAMTHDRRSIRSAAILGLGQSTEDLSPAFPLLRGAILADNRTIGDALQGRSAADFLALVLPMLSGSERRTAARRLRGSFRRLPWPGEALRPLLDCARQQPDLAEDLFELLSHTSTPVPGEAEALYRERASVRLVGRYPPETILPLIRATLSDPDADLRAVAYAVWLTGERRHSAISLLPLLLTWIPRYPADFNQRLMYHHAFYMSVGGMSLSAEQLRALCGLLIQHGDPTTRTNARNLLQRRGLEEPAAG